MDLDAADIAKQNKTYHKTQNMGVRKMNVTVLHAIQTPQWTLNGTEGIKYNGKWGTKQDSIIEHILKYWT